MHFWVKVAAILTDITEWIILLLVCCTAGIPSSVAIASLLHLTSLYRHKTCTLLHTHTHTPTQSHVALFGISSRVKQVKLITSMCVQLWNNWGAATHTWRPVSVWQQLIGNNDGVNANVKGQKINFYALPRSTDASPRFILYVCICVHMYVCVCVLTNLTLHRFIAYGLLPHINVKSHN